MSQCLYRLVEPHLEVVGRDPAEDYECAWYKSQQLVQEVVRISHHATQQHRRHHEQHRAKHCFFTTEAISWWILEPFNPPWYEARKRQT